MRRLFTRTLLTGLVAAMLVLVAASFAPADHIPGRSCGGCASHAHWPTIDGVIKKVEGGGAKLYGTERSDELLGRHGSDTLTGRGQADVLWGDHDPKGQPASQHDRIDGGWGDDFLYASHGRNTLLGGKGNDAISAHFGHGTIDCGPGRDLYHVPKSRKGKWKVKNCEKVDRRSERQRGGGLKPLK